VGSTPLAPERKTSADIPAQTPESVALSSALRQCGFGFVGPTICYAFMQATGLVNDHVTSCFRYRELADNLNSTADFAIARTAAVGAGDQLTIVDEFDTRTHFYGGQVGARAEYHWGAFFVSGALKVGLGDNVEKVVIGGSTTVVPPSSRRAAAFRLPTRGPTGRVTSGGVLTEPSNIGEYNADEFVVIPEVAVSVGYQITGHVRVFVGYDFLFWSDAVRSGNQIDRAVNPAVLRALFPTGHATSPDQPSFSFHQTSFWAQGGTFGVEVNY